MIKTHLSLKITKEIDRNQNYGNTYKKEHLDKVIAAFVKVGKEPGVIK